MAYTDRFIEMYREVTKGGQLSEAEVLALGQPPAPGLRIFKVFKYLLQRIEAVQQPGAEQIRAEVEAQLAQAMRANINKQVDARVNAALTAAKEELKQYAERLSADYVEAVKDQVAQQVEAKWRNFKRQIE